MIANEQLFPLTQAATFFPSPSRPHYGTVMRWALKGVGRPRHRLETVKLGGRRYTSREAVGRFVVHIGCDPPKPPDSEKRIGQILEAEQTLEEAGI